MKKIIAVLCIWATSCLHLPAHSRRDLSWMSRSTVTVLRLSGYRPAEGQPVGPFHGLDILEQHELDAESRAALVEFLIRVADREDSEFIQAERRGQVTGGVWGCVSGGHGLRFELNGQSYDFIVECGLWVQPADPAHRERPGPEGIRWVFTEEEGREWRAVFEKHFVKGGISGTCADLPAPSVELTERERCEIAALAARCTGRDRCLAECHLRGKGRCHGGGCFHSCFGYRQNDWTTPPGWTACAGKNHFKTILEVPCGQAN